MGYIDVSTRISMRWLPDPDNLPATTDVLVFNVGEYYVDVRISKESGEIEWAFAGVREVVSEEPLECRWIHIIDSTGQSTPDSGTFRKLPNGDDLEEGSMPCPEKGGAVTAYEEVWRTISPRKCGKMDFAWILQSVDGKCFLGRAVGGFLGMLARGDGEGERKGSFGVRWEEWDDGKGGWRSKYAAGSVEGLTSLVGLGEEVVEGEGKWKVGDEVVVQGLWFVVRAFERIKKNT